MDIEIREVSGKKDLRTFIYLPEKVHADHSKWVHPIYMDDWSYFNPAKNKAFGYCDTILLLAWRGAECVGRVMGIINHRYNEHRNEKTARFGFLETRKDPEVVRALLGGIEAWARSKGMTRVVGPYGFSDQDPEGFMIEGFEHGVTIASYYNFDWMPKLVEDAGYVKDIDYFVYKIDIPKEMPEFYKKIYERAQRKGGFEVLEFTQEEPVPALHPPHPQPDERDLHAEQHLRLRPARREGAGRAGEEIHAHPRSPVHQGRP